MDPNNNTMTTENRISTIPGDFPVRELYRYNPKTKKLNINPVVKRHQHGGFANLLDVDGTVTKCRQLHQTNTNYSFGERVQNVYYMLKCISEIRKKPTLRQQSLTDQQW